MTRTRLASAVLAALAVAAPALGDGPSARTPTPPDPARVRVLANVLRTDPDEKACRSAVGELAAADPRANPDVMPALLAALKRDAAAVRAAAAEAIGRFRAVFPVAGQALEAAADTDPSPAVRAVARQALWQYHLNGYRGTRGGDGLAASTAEPPLARPRAPVEPPAAIVPTGVSAPAPAPAPAPVAPPPGPRATLFPGLNGPRTLFATDRPRPQTTAEPPVARRPAPPSAEPPFAPWEAAPVPVAVPLPPLALDLPPIVPHPGVIPGSTPFPEPTAEPPIRKGAP
ncbi:MAG: hypothetical protein C0501_23070 [Isosphaera sp.]|nr:hypothetical protein [Isosphaera sp.]